MVAPRSAKRVIHRLFGDDRYVALEARYWRSRLRRLRYAYEFREEIAATVSPGETVLDVGANVGQYAVLLSGLVGPGGRVIAFEPVPRTFRILRSVVTGLGLSNVETMQVALADFDGPAALTEVVDSDGLPDPGLAHLSTMTESSTIDVAVARLDSMCDDPLGVDECSLVKIDVEGAELLVLRGAATFLATRRPTVVVEVDRGMSSRYDTSPEQLFAFLEELDYAPVQSSDTRPKSRDRPQGPSMLFRPCDGSA